MATRLMATVWTGTVAPKTLFKVRCELWHNKQYETCCLIMCDIGKVDMHGFT